MPYLFPRLKSAVQICMQTHAPREWIPSEPILPSSVVLEQVMHSSGVYCCAFRSQVYSRTELTSVLVLRVFDLTEDMVPHL